MPTKIFTTIGGNCPFGRKCAVDSTECRKCEWFYRTGTATFFWCRHPETPEMEREAKKLERKRAELERKSPEMEQGKRKRGRPPGKSTKPVMPKRKRGSIATKGKERPIKTIKQSVK